MSASQHNQRSVIKWPIGLIKIHCPNYFCVIRFLDSPYDVTYQIPYDAECNWKETGKMWYDIYSQQLKVCMSGAWRPAQMSQPGLQGEPSTFLLLVCVERKRIRLRSCLIQCQS
mgnify:CR=1 FL=1